jgi:hypothetical protein
MAARVKLDGEGHRNGDSEFAKPAAPAVEECIGGADPADAQLNHAYKGELEFAIASGI